VKKYWEFWLDERERSIRMSYIVIVEAVVIVILTYSLYRVYTAPKPIYVISPHQETGIVVPNKYSKVVVEDFVRHYLNLVYTYTPNTVKENLNQASNFIVPKLYAVTRYDFANAIQMSTQQNISSSIFIKSIKIKSKNNKIWFINVLAEVDKYFGSNAIKKNVLFKIIVKRGFPSNRNPYGLYIYSLEESEV